jgi:hypothetical protein
LRQLGSSRNQPAPIQVIVFFYRADNDNQFD